MRSALRDITSLRSISMRERAYNFSVYFRVGKNFSIYLYFYIIQYLSIYLIYNFYYSVLEKRFSDTSSCLDDFHPSLRSASPSWAGPSSQTMHCLSDLDTSMDSNEDKFRRPTSLPRCSSCIGKISHLTRYCNEAF
jgi:hypothetical protein